VDELALEFFATADTCFFVFAVVDFALLVLPLLAFGLLATLAVDVCPNAGRSEAQANINARAQPAPSHLRIFARCFGSKGNPQKISGQYST